MWTVTSVRAVTGIYLWPSEPSPMPGTDKQRVIVSKDLPDKGRRFARTRAG